MDSTRHTQAQASGVDWTAITMHPAGNRRQQAVMEELDRVGEAFSLEDALSHGADGGLWMLQFVNGNVNGQAVPRSAAADAAYRKRYRVLVRKDKWGQPVKPGDLVEWRMGMRTRDFQGRKYTITRIKDMERRGELRTIETWHEATVDEHGCISIPFEDALHLLSTRGTFWRSGRPLSGYRETAKEATAIPGGGGRLQHFWLYAEVPEAEYQKLGDATTERKRRGRPPKNNDASDAGVEAEG